MVDRAEPWFRRAAAMRAIAPIIRVPKIALPTSRGCLCGAGTRKKCIPGPAYALVSCWLHRGRRKATVHAHGL